MGARGDRALQLALQQWNLPVRTDKEPGETQITEYVKGADGLGWGWAEREGFNWCGAFAAYVYQDVKPELRREHFASTVRLDEWAEGTARAIPVEPAQVEPGDIILVGPVRGWSSGEEGAKTYKHGRHIAIVESVDPSGEYVNTIEGNTIGVLPDGKKRHGVGKDVRYFPRHGMEGKEWRIVAVIRPLEEDYSTPLPQLTKKGILARLRSKLTTTTVLLALGGIGAAGAALYFARRKKRPRRKKRR